MFVTPTRKFPDATLTGTVTAGQFRGLHANAPIVYTPLAGSCGANPWSEVFPVLASKGKLVMAPELRDMRNQTMLFVFAL